MKEKKLFKYGLFDFNLIVNWMETSDFSYLPTSRFQDNEYNRSIFIILI